MTSKDIRNAFSGCEYCLPSIGGWGDDEDINEEIQNAGTVIETLLRLARKNKELSKEAYMSASLVLTRVLELAENALLDDGD